MRLLMTPQTSSYRMKSPRLSVFFEITDNCNFHCNFCCKTWHGSYSSPCSRSELSLEDIDKILRIPKDWGKISGGEPAKCKNKVFYYLRRETARKSINTNLSLWTPQEVTSLCELVDDMTINIPSLDAGIHSHITTSTSSELNNILTCLPYVDTNKAKIALVVTEDNLQDVHTSLLRFAADYGFTQFLLSPRIPNGKSTLDFLHALNSIQAISEQHANLNIATVGPIRGCTVKGSHVCDAGLHRLVVLVNRNVVPCAWNNAHILGTLDDDLSVLLQRGKDYWESYEPQQRLYCKGYIENEKIYGEPGTGTQV